MGRLTPALLEHFVRRNAGQYSNLLDFQDEAMNQTSVTTSTVPAPDRRRPLLNLRTPRHLRAALDAAVVRWNTLLTEYEIDLKHLQELVT